MAPSQRKAVQAWKLVQRLALSVKRAALSLPQLLSLPRALSLLPALSLRPGALSLPQALSSYPSSPEKRVVQVVVSSLP